MKKVLLITTLGLLGMQATAQTITTLAGGPTAISLYDPYGVAVDDNGNIYVAEYGANIVIKIDHHGTATTVAGSGGWGYTGDGGPATDATFLGLQSIAIDHSGNLYISDANNNVIRKVDTSGTITTIAGNGTAGSSGDGGLATDAELNLPVGVAVDNTGNVYIADLFNDAIRKVDNSGTITTVAGHNGTEGYSGDGGAATSAYLKWPEAVGFDHNGNMIIADWGNQRVRKVTTSGTISTFAGNGTNGYSGDGGSATSAELSWPGSIALDSWGNIYIGDQGNNVVRMVDTSGTITTFAGNGFNNGDGDISTGAYTGDYGPADSASLNYPTTLAFDAIGNLYIADYSNQAIRKVSAINGLAHICSGDSSALNVEATGGTWGTTDGSVVQVNSSTQKAVGIGAGTASIYYAVGSDTAFVPVTVMATADAGTISGPDSLCLGTSFGYTDAVDGGIWKLTNTTAALWGTTIISEYGTGIDTLIYTVNFTCGLATTTLPVSIVQADAGIITGPTTVCQNDTVYFADSVAGGIWSLADTFGAYMVGTNGVCDTIPGYNSMLYTVAVPGMPTCTSTAEQFFIVDSASDCAALAAQNLNADHEVRIYPNPSSGIFTIELPNSAINAAITISDMTGKALYRQSTGNRSTISVNVANIPPGVYLLRIQQGATQTIKKIMIE